MQGEPLQGAETEAKRHTAVGNGIAHAVLGSLPGEGMPKRVKKLVVELQPLLLQAHDAVCKDMIENAGGLQSLQTQTLILPEAAPQHKGWIAICLMLLPAETSETC